MSESLYDVVIIGGGMSGLMAGIYLAGKGFKTAIISRGDPVCCLSTGCIDLLDAGVRPLEAIVDLPDGHPYRLVGKKGIDAALKVFRDIMAFCPIPYVGSARHNREILTPIGTFKTTCLVPRTMEASQGCRDEYLHVISFAGIRDFYPSYITSKLPNTGFSLYDAGVSSTLAIATRFEEAGFVDEFCTWLSSLEIPPGRVALPAVLGLVNPMAVMEEISGRIGRDVFEIPTLPPSIPGLRLFRTLKKSFQDRGGDVFWGKPISSVETRGNVVEAVTLAASGRPSRVQGRAFILATGSFVSGGLYAARDAVSETVFGLPVEVPGARKDWFLNDFFTHGHPIEGSGIEVDASFRPRRNELENLFVCGSILAGSEIMKHHCGHGLALATGLKAAISCERALP
ncbi:MAG TPA: anaerobic glycerol-3-phosphate dehydrogenase subunit B [Deltaproteobacteria bacterium]|nr:anaerobic glycerol-3-phosphate dehydrogenase subunit B [Deltaproteobacteria bacterium]